MHAARIHSNKIACVSLTNTSAVWTGSVAAVGLVADTKIASRAGSGFQEAGQDASCKRLVSLDHFHKTFVMIDLGDIVNKVVCDGSLQGWVGQMYCVRTIELFHTTNELFRSPGALEKNAEIRDDCLAKTSNIVLIGDDEDVQTEDQAFFGGAGGIRDLLGVGQVVHVAHHRMHSSGISIVSKINFLAGRNLSKASVLSPTEPNL